MLICKVIHYSCGNYDGLTNTMSHHHSSIQVEQLYEERTHKEERRSFVF